jgi:chromatin structure-remodeling complex subunit RSC9
MAPKDKQPREETIERTPEYEEFLDKLAEYHEKRGFCAPFAHRCRAQSC